MISPIFEKIAAKSDTTKIEFYKVDVDELPDVSQEVGIRAVCIFSLSAFFGRLLI